MKAHTEDTNELFNLMARHIRKRGEERVNLYLVDEPEPTELQTVKNGQNINSDSSDNEIMENIDKFLLGNNDKDPNLQMIIKDFCI